MKNQAFRMDYNVQKKNSIRKDKRREEVFDSDSQVKVSIKFCFKCNL